jgi:hypothetical protein
MEIPPAPRAGHSIGQNALSPETRREIADDGTARGPCLWGEHSNRRTDALPRALLLHLKVEGGCERPREVSKGMLPGTFDYQDATNIATGMPKGKWTGFSQGEQLTAFLSKIATCSPRTHRPRRARFRTADRENACDTPIALSIYSLKRGYCIFPSRSDLGRKRLSPHGALCCRIVTAGARCLLRWSNAVASWTRICLGVWMCAVLGARDRRSAPRK